MNKKLIIGLATALFSLQTFAASFGVFDPRSLAMGGTGVASGDASNASHYNPALLATTHDDDDFSLVLPTFTVGVSDPNNLADALDNYGNANYETSLDSAIVAFNGAANAADVINGAATLSTSVQGLKDGVNTLSNKSLIINANAGVLLAIPSKFIAVSVYSTGRVVGGTNLAISNADNVLLQDYIDVLACIGALTAGTDTLTEIEACDSGTTDVINAADGSFNNLDTAGTMTSTVNLQGAAISETGVSLAHNFESLGGISLGVTPKSVVVDTFDSAIGINAANNTDIADGRKKYSDTNLDVGISMKILGNIKVGVVSKNIITKSYKTVLGNTVKIEPQMRAGLAYQNDWILIAADMDLTENEGLGFENKTQDLAVGMEMDLFDIMQFRAGYRQNLANDTNADDGTSSIGVGLSPFGIHLDLAVASNNAGIQAGLQLGFKF